MTRDEVAKSIGAAAHAWSPAAVTCADGVSHPYLEIVPSMAPDGAVPPTPAYDARNTLLFYTPSWPYPPAKSRGSRRTSSRSRRPGRAPTATSSTPTSRINAGRQRLREPRSRLRPPANGDMPFDLQNAMTHEFGHFLGLGHTCWTCSAIRSSRSTTRAPRCRAATPRPPTCRQTVMFATIRPGSSRPRSASCRPTTSAAVCAIYPAAAGSARLHARHARRRLRLQRRRAGDRDRSMRACRARGLAARVAAATPALMLRRVLVLQDPSSSTRRSRTDGLAQARARRDVELLLGGAEPGRRRRSAASGPGPAAADGTCRRAGRRRSPSRRPGPTASSRPRATAAPVACACTSPAMPPGKRHGERRELARRRRRGRWSGSRGAGPRARTSPAGSCAIVKCPPTSATPLPTGVAPGAAAGSNAPAGQTEQARARRAGGRRRRGPAPRASPRRATSLISSAGGATPPRRRPRPGPCRGRRRSPTAGRRPAGSASANCPPASVSANSPADAADGAAAADHHARAVDRATALVDDAPRDREPGAQRQRARRRGARPAPARARRSAAARPRRAPPRRGSGPG